MLLKISSFTSFPVTLPKYNTVLNKSDWVIMSFPVMKLLLICLDTSMTFVLSTIATRRSNSSPRRRLLGHSVREAVFTVD